jgi:hypothetical protein
MRRTHLIFPVLPIVQPRRADWRVPVVSRYIAALIVAWEHTKDEKMQARIERMIAFADTLPQ